MKITTFLNSQKTANLLSYFVIIAGVFLFIMFGVLQWPGLHWDAALYATPIINLATGNGWRFDSYSPVLVYKYSHDYSFHGLLTPIIFGIIIKTSTYENLLLWCGIFNAITFIVYTFLFHRALNKKFPIWSLLIATIFGAMAGVICQELQGRPEHLAALLMAIPLLMREFAITRKWSRYGGYTMPGLLFILSPLLGVIYGMGLLFWLGIKYKKKLWKQLILAGLLSLGISGLIIIIFCPFSPWQWISNTFLIGNSQFIPTDWWRLTSISLSPKNLFISWNYLVLVVIFFVLKTLWQQKFFIILPIWVLLGIYLLPKVQVYIYIGFFPLFLLMILGRSDHWITQSERIKKLLPYGSMIFAIPHFLTLINSILLLIIYAQQGVSLAQTKAKVEQLSNQLDLQNERIGFFWMNRPSFVVFEDQRESLVTVQVDSSVLEQSQKLDSVLSEYEKKFEKKIVYIILPQLGHLNQPPATLNKGMFKLIDNGWTKKRAKFMGIKLGGAIPGYQFALYKRVK